MKLNSTEQLPVSLSPTSVSSLPTSANLETIVFEESSIESAFLSNTDSSDQSTRIAAICSPTLILTLSTKSVASSQFPGISPKKTISLDKHVTNISSPINQSNNHTIDIAPLIATILPNHHPSQPVISQVSNELSSVLNLTKNEIDTLRKVSNAINEIIQKQAITPSSSTVEVGSSSPVTTKKQRYQRQRQIINIAKQALKPTFKQHDVTKEEYKKIMKKVVTKAMYTEKVDQKWIRRMIDAYVHKYRAVYNRHHM